MHVTLSLSDPWEMGEALGWPTLRGAVVQRGAEAWLVELTEPFSHSGTEYRFLVVSARHFDSPLANAATQQIACNVVRTTEERASGPDACDLSWWRGGCAMICSITGTC